MDFLNRLEYADEHMKNLPETDSEPDVLPAPENASWQYYRDLLVKNWGLWISVMRKYELEGLTLGQVSSSLHLLPECFWQETLQDYLQLEPDQIARRFEGQPERYIPFVRTLQRLYLFLTRESRIKPHPRIVRCLEGRFARQMNQVMQDLFLRKELSRAVVDLQLLIPILNELGDHLDQEVLDQVSRTLGLSRPLPPPAAEAVRDSKDIVQAMQTLWPEGPLWFARFLQMQQLLQCEAELLSYLQKSAMLFFGIDPKTPTP